MDALRLKPSDKLDRSRLSYVRGAEFFRRARLWWIVLPKSGPVANAIAQTVRGFVKESAMDKFLADVEAMFSAIADSIYKRQLPKLEY